MTKRQNRVADSNGKHTEAASSKLLSMGIDAAEANAITEIMLNIGLRIQKERTYKR